MACEKVPYIFSKLSIRQAPLAHAFHLSLASKNPFIKQRDLEQMREFAENGELFGVRRANSCEPVATCYATLHEEEGEYEMGGLGVADQDRKVGLASVLIRVAIAHIIAYDEFHKSFEIVAYVDASNLHPRKLLKTLEFESIGRISRAGAIKEKFAFLPRRGLPRLSEWFDNFNGFLQDGIPAVIESDLDNLKAVLRLKATAVQGA
jgi:hypothetical protein